MPSTARREKQDTSSSILPGRKKCLRIRCRIFLWVWSRRSVPYQCLFPSGRLRFFHANYFRADSFIPSDIHQVLFYWLCAILRHANKS